MRVLPLWLLVPGEPSIRRYSLRTTPLALIPRLVVSALAYGVVVGGRGRG